MKSKTEQDIKVGIFVSIGMAFAMVAILVLGGSESIFRAKLNYKARFPNASGLLSGAKVALSGLNVGLVKEVEYEGATKSILVTFAVDKRYAKEVRDGSTVEIVTQGVLGDKFISLIPGSGENILPENAILPNVVSQDLNQLISKSDALLANGAAAAASLDRLLRSLEKGNRLENMTEDLAAAAKNLKNATAQIEGRDLSRATKNLAQILDKVNQGSGTLGALINDPSLYEDVRSVVGGANRNRIIRNLVRKTAKDSYKNGGPTPGPVTPSTDEREDRN